MTPGNVESHVVFRESANRLVTPHKTSKMSSSQFSTLQKLALAAIVMGGIMCLVGLIVPYWAVFGIDGAEGDLGLWMLCGKIWKVSSCGIIPFFLTGVELARYGWGLYVFGAGFVVLALASFVACFAAPVNPPVGYIVGTSSPTVVVAQSSSNTNMSNTYQPYPPASYPPSAYPPASYPPSTYPPSAYPPSAYPPSAYPPSAYPPSAYPPNTCSPNPVSDSSSICTSEMPPGGYSTSGKVLD
ncbi:hypothetical protein C0Q70_01181 [Pomacea canaliculata]|uniref:Uncharacterized protein n=1 Tax=Pomacea canaliculata TaxID=400727 RepID=A0A2T7PYR2_POMCA|nr:hypothetical protein C0Q70_01181 [Pomacea canaliculata]